MTAPKRERKRDHVVLDNNVGAFLCLNCGQKYLPTMPCPLNMMVAMMRSFAAGHRRCKPRPGGVAR